MIRLKTVTPGNLLAQAKIEDEIAETRHRQSRRSSSSFVVPDFRSSEKVLRPSSYFEPKKDQCFLSAATFPDGISSGSAAPAPKTGLGSHVPIHPSSRHLLCFAYKGRVYQYQVLPFGLKNSPWVFTRLVAVLLASL